jgi:hypothetical protein
MIDPEKVCLHDQNALFFSRAGDDRIASFGAPRSLASFFVA